jgi:hypothetical protein
MVRSGWHLWNWSILSLLCCAVMFPSPTHGADDLLQVESAVVGFGGVYKAGYWTQVIVTLKAGPAGAEGRLNLLTEDGDGVPVIFPHDLNAPLALKGGETATIRLYAKAGPERSRWDLQLRTGEDDQVLWSHRLNVPPPQPATQELLVSFGTLPNLEAAARALKRPEEVAMIPAVVLNAQELPDRVWGYEGVERILLLAGEKSIVTELSPAQREALEQWTKLGGKLIFSIGERGPELLHPDDPSQLAEFVPGTFSGLDPLRSAYGRDTFRNLELPPKYLTGKTRPSVVQLSNRTGQAELEQGGQQGYPPLVIRQAFGLGQVIFVAFDLNHPTLVEWNGYSKLVESLLELGGPKGDNLAAATERSITHRGYNDLVGQLRAVLDQFPGVTVVSFTAVAMVIVLFLLLIGPVDYFLIRYFRLPAATTWFTFPTICLIFAGGAWYLGKLAHGETTRVNQVEIIDLDASQGIVRGTLWTHLYSPHGRDWQMALAVAGNSDQWQGVHGMVDWQGLPGSGLGGLASPQIAFDASQPYRISPPGQIALIDSLPLRTASPKSLSARWWGRTDLTKSLSPLQLGEYGRLEGELKNPLPVQLDDCLLVVGEWLYRIHDPLKPGDSLPARTLTALNLEARLTRRQVFDSKEFSTPWRTDDTDLPRIMQMLMLHQAVRGPTYTRMSHRYQPQIDLSEHLRLGRAILIGRGEAPVAQLDLADLPPDQLQTQSWIWYRIVLPVEKLARGK